MLVLWKIGYFYNNDYCFMVGPNARVFSVVGPSVWNGLALGTAIAPQGSP